MPRRLALAFLLPLAACTSFQVTGETRPTPARVSRITSVQGPLNLALVPAGGGANFQYCSARLVEGTVMRVDADTVIFSAISRIDPTVAFDPACRTGGVARLVYAPGTAQVSEERNDRRRTIGTLVLIGFAAIMLGGALLDG